MLFAPWLSEPTLRQALRYAMGQDLEEDTCAEELAGFLDRLQISDAVRKDRLFRANASLPLFNCRLLTPCSFGCI